LPLLKLGTIWEIHPNKFEILIAREPQIPQSAYLHIPFCRQRCLYCDFPIEVLGEKARAKTDSIDEYLRVLCREVIATPNRGKSLETIFFGGGTPSLMSVEQLETILDCLQSHFGIVKNAEISIEIDPGTFTEDKLRGYKQAGITRVSLGVQAFTEELLRACGRSHSVADIYSSVTMIERVGIDNYSLDLISGLPHQTIDLWQDALQKSIDLHPQHISCYDLVLEEATAFGKRYQPGEQPLPSDEQAASMYRLASQTLREAGYEHYEISNYAKAGYQCLHNRIYWENRPYYGFGMGAASYVDDYRWTRPLQKQDYYRWATEYVDRGGVMDIPCLTTQDLLLETLMLGLRLAEGINLEKLGANFGRDTVERLQRVLSIYREQNWIAYFDRGENRAITTASIDFSRPIYLRLKDPEGFLFSNTILTALFAEFETFPHSIEP
jgi:putative oxygen-independent coproporphyrinogen III oxidase